MATATTSTSTKRRRISSQRVIDSISNLPEVTLAHVASYLTNPSRAIFAVAISAPSPSWKKKWRGAPSAAIKAILGDEPWGVLDFDSKVPTSDNRYNPGYNYIECDLAGKLTDDDVAAILLCIDAVKKLRKIRLSGYMNLAGNGLEPLRGSRVLEHIDFSLIGNPFLPKPNPDRGFSQEIVLPVIDSILDAPGNSIELIRLPRKWLSRIPSGVDQFLQRYNQFLGNRRAVCSECDQLCGDQWVAQDHRGLHYGEQNYTCFHCLRNFCGGYECKLKDSWKFKVGHYLICCMDWTHGNCQLALLPIGDDTQCNQRFIGSTSTGQEVVVHDWAISSKSFARTASVKAIDKCIQRQCYSDYLTTHMYGNALMPLFR